MKQICIKSAFLRKNLTTMGHLARMRTGFKPNRRKEAFAMKIRRDIDSVCLRGVIG